MLLPSNIGSHGITGYATVNRGVGNTIATQTVGTVYTTTVLTGGKQTGHLCRCIDVKLHTAHHIVRGRHDLDPAASQVKATVGTALDHTGKSFGDILGTKVRHLDIDTAHWCSVARSHFRIDTAADDIAGGTLGVSVVVQHKAFAITI